MIDNVLHPKPWGWRRSLPVHELCPSQTLAGRLSYLIRCVSPVDPVKSALHFKRSRDEHTQRDPRPHGSLAKPSSCSPPLTAGYDSSSWPAGGQRFDRSMVRTDAKACMLRRLACASSPAVVPEIW
jgi:hypothetical protein